MGHLAHGHAEDLGGRDGVDVLAAEEGLPHDVVMGDVGQHAQLDLGIVGVEEDTAVARHEAAPDLGTQLLPHGDVLHVGIGGRQAARGRHHLVEGGVDAPVGADDLQKAVDVGGFQLRQLAVFEDQPDDLMLGA